MTALLADPEAPAPFYVVGNFQQLWPEQYSTGRWKSRLGREVLLEGGAGTGKTTQVLMHDRWYGETFPNSRILWLRATLVSLRQSVLVSWEEEVLGPGKNPWKNGKASRATRMSYRHTNGSEIVLGGLDDADKLMSMEYSLIRVFEAIQVSLPKYEKLLTRLRWPHGPYRQILCDTNPGPETHWLNKRPEQPHSKHKGKPQMHRIKTVHRDNPRMWDYANDCRSEFGEEYIADTLGGMSGARLLNYVDGVWASAEGLVWPDYDRTLHTVDREHVPALSTYIASMDFGFNAPGCLQVWGTSGDGKWYRVAEQYRAGLNINQWADLAAELWAEYRFKVGVADCAEPGSIDILNRKLGQMEGRHSGAVFIPANKSRGKQHGLDQVRAAMDPAQEDGCRFFLVRGASRYRQEELARAGKPTCFEEEIVDYTFLPPDPDKPIRETPDPKKPNEACDAAEYFWTWVFGKYKDAKPVADYAPGTAGAVLWGGKAGSPQGRRR